MSDSSGHKTAMRAMSDFVVAVVTPVHSLGVATELIWIFTSMDHFVTWSRCWQARSGNVPDLCSKQQRQQQPAPLCCHSSAHPTSSAHRSYPVGLRRYLYLYNRRAGSRGPCLRFRVDELASSRRAADLGGWSGSSSSSRQRWAIDRNGSRIETSYTAAGSTIDMMDGQSQGTDPSTGLAELFQHVVNEMKV